MVELSRRGHSATEDSDTGGGDNRKKIAVTGVVIAAAAAAFALGRHLLEEQKLKKMQTIVLKADNGTEAHIRPLGCCIQRMPLTVAA